MQDMMPTSPGTHARRAYGRSLADFRVDGKNTPHGLWSAEEALLTAVGCGEVCSISDALPDSASEDNRVRGAFLRFLLLGGDGEAPVHEKGVQLSGAFVIGDIDLESAEVDSPLWLLWCRVEGQLIGRNARLGCLGLPKSHILGITCDGAKVAVGVFLHGGFTAEGGVRFSGAEIGGQLNCSKGAFKNASGVALTCDGAKVTGDVFLSGGFTAKGEVSFSGAKIGEDLACMGGSFGNRNAAARTSDGEPLTAANALNLQDATIRGVLYLGPGMHPNNKQVFIEGSINLQGAHATTLIDDPKSWAAASSKTEKHRELPRVMRLDGFTYDRFGGVASTGAGTRRKWLLRQPLDHLSNSFRPQPFEQLIKVLRSMGHTRDARDIGFFKEYCRLHRPWRSWRKRLNPFAWLWWLARWLLLEKALGHGYYLHRMVMLAVAVCLGCGFIYQEAARHDLFAPTNPRVYLDQKLKEVCTSNGKPAWTSGHCHPGQLVPEYTVFDPYAFSFDVILPIVSLRQEDDWQPLYSPVRWSIWGLEMEFSPLRLLAWFETIFAWVWSLSLSAVVTGIIKRD